MHCPHHQAGRCRSCTRIEWPVAQQLQAHQQHAQQLLADWPALSWLPPLASPASGFRNKAKMVVSGTAQAPVLGIIDPHGQAVDLADCALYPASLQACFAALREFIGRAAIVPYDLQQRRGELKYVLLTQDLAGGKLLLRLVLRSREALDRIRRELPWLQTRLPQLEVVSVNLQPVHQAVLEGPTEILLSESAELKVRINQLELHLRPQSFFQTNTVVAAALYAQVREWVRQLAPASVLDLYCGVGGFALHCAAPDRQVSGLELSAEAVLSARSAALAAGLPQVQFHAADAGRLEVDQLAAELVIVNPPRRGIGTALARQLAAAPASSIIYSSCNAQSLAQDLQQLKPFRPVRAQVFQMFPHTDHYELLTLLQRA